MDDELGHTDDISQLWGDGDNGAWEPAPLRRPSPPPPPPATHGAPDWNGSAENGQAGRLDALERDVRALVQVVERVEALVNGRLSRLEQQVEDLAGGEERHAPKGIGRLTGVIKSTRNR